jgi:alkane 1-monooxygenase
MSLLKKLGFFSAFILPILVVGGWYAGGYWNFLASAFTFGFIPLIDYLVGGDSQNPDEAQISALTEARYYRFITFVWVYVQIGMVGWGAYVFATQPTQWFEALGFFLGMAQVTGGIGITVAHELGHQRNRLEQVYSQVLLMTVCYMHFFIEHNKGHHVWVATPKDPATSRRGETFYGFWWRTVSGSWLSAWRIEAQALQRAGHRVWSWRNTMLWYVALPMLWMGALMVMVWALTGQWDAQVVFFFLVQSVLAFSLLEAVNYIEHYGIERKEIANGRYERVNPLHSWNANQLVTNFFLFQLQRHSDHHANATRRYQTLRHFEESPQLPFGYPTMIWIALWPPAWFKLMDNRLENWKESRKLA